MEYLNWINKSDEKQLKGANCETKMKPSSFDQRTILVILTALDTIHDRIHPRNPVYYRRTISIIKSTFAIRNNRWSRRMSIYIESSQHRVQFQEFRIDDRIIEQPG